MNGMRCNHAVERVGMGGLKTSGAQHDFRLQREHGVAPRFDVSEQVLFELGSFGEFAAPDFLADFVDRSC